VDLYGPFFGYICRFGDSGLDISAFTNANAYLAFVITYDHQSLEAKTPAASYDAGNTVNINYPLVKLFGFLWPLLPLGPGVASCRPAWCLGFH
jgi:hypothetical protein